MRTLLFGGIMPITTWIFVIGAIKFQVIFVIDSETTGFHTPCTQRLWHWSRSEQSTRLPVTYFKISSCIFTAAATCVVLSAGQFTCTLITWSCHDVNYVVIMTIYNATSVDKVAIMTNLGFQYSLSHICTWVCCVLSCYVLLFIDHVASVWFIYHILHGHWHWHDDVIKWDIFRVTGPLWGESTGHRWITLTKTSDAELWCFLWSAPEQTYEQTIETPVIWQIKRQLRHGS